MPKIVCFSPLFRTPNRSAFTLLELLIVILLLSLTTFVIFGSMKRSVERQIPKGIPALRDLPRYLTVRAGELVCTEACSRCVFLTPDHEVRTLDFTLPPLRAYAMDAEGELSPLEFGRYHDTPICLRYRYFATGAGSRMVLQTKDQVYFLPAFFGKTERFSSLRAAADFWRRDEDLLRNRGNYY